MDRYAGAPTIILVGASGSSTHYGEAQGDQKMRGELPGPAAQLSVDLGNGLPAFVRTSSPSDCYCRMHFFSFRLLLQDTCCLEWMGM
jgi:hypothetical protein